MNCEWVNANVSLYLYNELRRRAHEVEQHVQRCDDCATELKSVQEFSRGQMSDLPRLEPSPSFLAASRWLAEALDPRNRSEVKRFFDPTAWLRQMKFSPALATVLLMIRFWRDDGVPDGRNSGAGGPGVIRPISGKRRLNRAGHNVDRRYPHDHADPNSNKVEIKFDSLQPQTVEGNLNDARIQQLLLYAARNNTNSGLRQD